jgi:Arc/MetJ-type ribon-helix-helix transcriptional regulator
MTIELSSDDAALAQQLIDSGEFESVEDLPHSALLILHREAINSHIGASLDEAARGETVSLDEARTFWAAQRQEWLAANKQQ